MTSTSVTGRAVICDDDALIRRVIRQVLRESPVEIVGDAESPEEAMACIRASDANILVLDLALRGGSGERLLQWVREQGDGVHVVVYSAYAADHAQLLGAGACAVIEKPDFSRLQTAIEHIVSALGVRVDRRASAGTLILDRLPPPTSVSLSGFEPWDSFLAAMDAAHAGDAVVCADVLPGPSVKHGWDPVFQTDHRLALGRAMARGKRMQDRISVSPTGRPVLLVVRCRPEAPTVVFRRLCDRWSREVDLGTPVAAYCLLHDGDDHLERLSTVDGSVATDRTTPLRMV